MGFCDFRTKRMAELMTHVISKQQAAYDHVAIDVRHATAGMVRMAEELSGQERDTEIVRMVQKHIFGILLRRVQPKKSIALLPSEVWNRPLKFNLASSSLLRITQSPLPAVGRYLHG